MKKTQLFFALVFISLVVWMLVKQSGSNKKLYKVSLRGEVIAVGKKLKGYYDMRIIEGNKLRQISFDPKNDTLTVSAGDSVYKESNSDIFYIKKKETSTFIKAEWGDTHISGEWEE